MKMGKPAQPVAQALAQAVRAPAAGEWLVRVTDLKQYAYCPRIVYYTYCLPHLRPTTYKMAAGIAAQAEVTDLEERRSLRAYGVQTGTRHFHVPVQSATLGCVGQVDMVIETEGADGDRLIPVDFKLSRTPGRHFQLQLTCYGLMLEEMTGLPAPEGYLYLIQTRQAEKVVFTSRLRRDAKAHLATIRQFLYNQAMPQPTAQRARCVDCEFRRFCNDVL
jgi:CRISPR-associated exonuclease Cas4